MAGHASLQPGPNGLVQYQPLPIWSDGPPSFRYVTAPPTAPPPHVPNPARSPEALEPAKKPRPRKPYTATKTREMWSPEEHDRMLEGLKRFKRDWAKVTEFVGTRSPAQVRSHAQKYFDRVARDKTDDYVPQARPKRKSATPYPRKVRSEQQAAVQQLQHAPSTQSPPHDHQNIQYQLQQHGPVQVAYPVNSFGHVIAPAAPSPYLQHPSPVQPIAYSVHPQMQHQIPHVPLYHQGNPHSHLNPQWPHPQLVQQPPSPALSAVPIDAAGNPCPQNYQFFPTAMVNGIGHPTRPSLSPQMPSPNLLQSPQPHVFGQVPAGAVRLTRVYSPYLGVNGSPANTHMSPTLYNESPHPPSGPFDGRSYAIQPPPSVVKDAAAQPNGHTSYYSALSPLTPAVPYGICPSPASQEIQGSFSQTVVEKGPHMPRHAHPDGPDPNCAKCNALKRFGNVLHELGALRKAKGQGQVTTDNVEKRSAIPSHARRNANVSSSDSEKPPGSPCTTPSLVEVRSSQPPVSVRHISQKYDATRPHHVPGHDVVCLSPRLTPTSAADSNPGNRSTSNESLPAKLPMQISEEKMKTPSPSDDSSLEQNRNGKGNVREECDSVRLAAKRRHIRAKVLKARKNKPGSGSNGQGGALESTPSLCHSIDADKLAALANVNHGKVMKKHSTHGIRSERCSAARSSNSRSVSGETGVKVSQKRILSSTEPDMSNKKLKMTKIIESNACGNAPAAVMYSRNEQKELFDAVRSLQILGKTPTPER